MKNFLVSLGVALVLTGISYITGVYLNWITEISWLEIFAVFTSFSCTYLCVMQSRWNYPIGMISVAALTWLFWTSGLIASAALNAYLVPALLYGWWRWGPDSDTRPVTNLAWDRWLLVYAGVTVGTYLALVGILTLIGTTLPVMDSLILVGSILAQFLLDNKKIETWYVWAVVNVIAIITYFNAGLFLVVFQFVFFLANTVYGWYKWKQSQKADMLLASQLSSRLPDNPLGIQIVGHLSDS